MALIECPDCSKPVSNNAWVCPNCGVPISEQAKATLLGVEERAAALKTRKRQMLVGWLMILAAFVSVAVLPDEKYPGVGPLISSILGFGGLGWLIFIWSRGVWKGH